MYSGRSSSTSPPETTLAESASLVPEDHIPNYCLAAWVVTEESLYHYRRRSSPSLGELLPRPEAGSRELGNRLRGSCAMDAYSWIMHSNHGREPFTLIWASLLMALL